MIKFKDLVPEVYYNTSRDFQLLSHLFELVLNSVKTDIDIVYNIPNPEYVGTSFINTFTKTLGFRSKHDYEISQLAAICSIFPTIMKKKGSLAAIELIGNTLLNASGSSATFYCELDKTNQTIINAYFPDNTVDLNLFNDLLDYILPAGMLCHNIMTNISTQPVLTESTFEHKVTVQEKMDGIDMGVLSDLNALTDDSKYDSEHNNIIYVKDSKNEDE